MKNVNVSAAIIINEGKILAAQRGYGEFKGGWEFPGGKIESGETKENALKRELREELSAEIESIKEFKDIVYDYPTFHLTMTCFTVKLKDNYFKLNEHSSFKWLSAEDLYSVEWLPADIAVIEDIKSYLKGK